MAKIKSNKPEKNSYSIIIPVFNSRNTLSQLIESLEKTLQKICGKFEILLVEDGSKDDSWEMIQKLSSKNAGTVFGIKLMRNYGQHNAVLCGIQNARNKIIITMDDDLQHPATEIKKMSDKLNEGYDVVYGIPEKEQHGLLRDLASQATKLALKNSMGVETARNVSSFRIFRSELCRAFEHYKGPFISIDVLLSWATTNFGYVVVQHEKRKAGKSNYSFSKLVRHAFNMITGYSALPLQFASILGFIFTIFGFFILLYVIGRYLFEGSVQAGFPFLASIIAIFSGVQLFALGIIGEYIARMHFRLMDKLPFVVRVKTQNYRNDQRE